MKIQITVECQECHKQDVQINAVVTARDALITSAATENPWCPIAATALTKSAHCGSREAGTSGHRSRTTAKRYVLSDGASMKQRIWLCMGCKRDLPRTEDNLFEILTALRTLKPCACGGYWQATVAGKDKGKL